MQPAQHFGIKLPLELADPVERQVRSGSYASASEVKREALLVLRDGETALEQWLRDEVVGSYDEYKADPSAAVSADQVMGRVRRAALPKAG